jgi:hypothetical protein
MVQLVLCVKGGTAAFHWRCNFEISGQLVQNLGQFKFTLHNVLLFTFREKNRAKCREIKQFHYVFDLVGAIKCIFAKVDDQ